MNPSDPPAETDQAPGPGHGPIEPETRDAAEAPDVAEAAEAPGPPPRLGTSTFTIEGRSAPGLFVVGWLATLVGLGCVAIAVLSGDTTASRVLLIGGLIPLSVGLIAGAGSQGIERRVRARLPYVGPSPFLVLAASVPISILVLLAVSVPLAIVGVPLDGPFGALLSVAIQAVVYVGLVRLLVVDTGALDWAAMGIGRLDGRAIGEILGGALWALPVVFVTGVLASVLFLFVPVQPTSPLPPTGTAVGIALSLLAGVVVAPLGEEILFRGFATTAWVRGHGVVAGIVLGAVVFAFAHIITVSGGSAGEALGQAFVAFVARIPIALSLGWLFVRRRTIWASFGLHAAFNGILLVVAEVARRGT